MTNATAEPGVEALFTQALRVRTAEADVDAAAGSSDAELRGEILALYFTPTAIQGSFRLNATVRLRLVRDGKVLSEVVVTGAEDFLSYARDDDGKVLANRDPILQPESNKQVALQRLAELLMRDGYEQIASAF